MARLIITFALLISIGVYSIVFHINTTFAETSGNLRFVSQKDESVATFVTEPDPDRIEAAKFQKEKEQERKREEARKQRERQVKVDRILNYLARQNSVVANEAIAGLILDHSEANGADFRVVIAIMGVESGFCNASFWYNCFGYLNGVRYSSYYDAFNDLVPKVARQYAARYGWNFEGLAQAYGQHEWERTAGNMRYFASSI